MKYYDPEDIRRMEKDIMRVLGVSQGILMENAGHGAAAAILSRFPGRGAAAVLVGPGNNGGDGLVAARWLSLSGWDVSAVCSLPLCGFKGINVENLHLAEASGVRLLEASSLTDGEIGALLRRADLAVDALLGTGSSGSPRGETARLIRLCSEARFVVSLDLPSGMDPLSGDIESCAVRARLTLTMLAPKTGMAFPPGKDASGEIQVIPLGFPGVSAVPPRVSLLEMDEARALLPKRDEYLHKGERGGVLVAGGCDAYRGAPVLALRGALRAGCGLGILFSDERICAACSASLPEAVFLPLRQGVSLREVSCMLGEWESRAGCLVLGPGMGRSAEAGELFRFLREAWKGKIVVDGDGLYHLSRMKRGAARREGCLVTPHEGEAARLLGISPEEVRKNRLKYARELASNWGTALLKGKDTLVDDGSATVMISEGNRALAVPGSGDVLAGAAAAFMAAGLDPFGAGSLAAFVHGSAGRSLSERLGKDGILASQVADEMPSVLCAMERKDPKGLPAEGRIPSRGRGKGDWQ